MVFWVRGFVCVPSYVSSCGVFPIGISPDRFANACREEAVQKLSADFRRKYRGKVVLLSVDRLDYTKGIPHKLYALERFFETCPKWRSRVVRLARLSRALSFSRRVLSFSPRARSLSRRACALSPSVFLACSLSARARSLSLAAVPLLLL